MIGASRTLEVIVRDIPDLGRAALIAGAIIEMHFLSVKVQATRGYSGRNCGMEGLPGLLLGRSASSNFSSPLHR